MEKLPLFEELPIKEQEKWSTVITELLGHYAFRLYNTHGIPLNETLKIFETLSGREKYDLALGEWLKQKKERGKEF